MTFLDVFLIAYAIIITRIAYNSRKKSSKLLLEIETLRAERRKLSDAVRRKGVEADNLKTKIRILKRSSDK